MIEKKAHGKFATEKAEFVKENEQEHSRTKALEEKVVTLENQLEQVRIIIIICVIKMFMLRFSLLKGCHFKADFEEEQKDRGKLTASLQLSEQNFSKRRSKNTSGQKIWRQRLCPVKVNSKKQKRGYIAVT